MPVGELADVVVLGACPRDATIYHGSFALPCAVPLSKPGAAIIWAAPCLSGPGTREQRIAFRDRLTMPSDELMAAIKRGEVPASGGVFDWCLGHVVQRNRVVLVSDRISRDEAVEFGFAVAPSIQEALDAELAANPAARVRVDPVGGLAVPIYP